jgi:hypothetical protein
MRGKLMERECFMFQRSIRAIASKIFAFAQVECGLETGSTYSCGSTPSGRAKKRAAPHLERLEQRSILYPA